MTASEIEQAAREEYNAVNDSFFSQSSIFTLINKAQTELATKAFVIENKDTSISTVASTRAYAFPTRVIAIKRIEYDGSKLDPIDFRDDDLVNIYPATTTTGTPRFYSIWDEYIYLRPIPAAVKTLTIYCYSLPTPITAGGDTPDIPALFHYDIVDYILMNIAAKDENWNAVSWYKGRWEQHVQDAIKWKSKLKRADGPASVKDEDLARKTVLGIK